jgi:hypothetical protein
MTETRDARLTWGQVALISDGADPSLPYRIDASADGTNWGNADAVIRAIQSRLQDGQLAAIDSYGNREAPIYLEVTSDTYDGLGAGEDALAAEARRPGYNTLTWTPHELLAARSVFDVVYGVVQFSFDDLSELQLKRRFTATLTCLPFPRADTEVVATAIPVPPAEPTTVNVDDGTSAADWTTQGGTSTASGGAILNTRTGDGLTVIRAETLDISTLKYLVVDWTGGALRVLLSGPTDPGTPLYPALTLVSQGPSPVTGYTRSTYAIPDDQDSTAAIWFLLTRTTPDTNLTLAVANIDLTDTPPTSTGTRRQLFRTLPVAGSVRTQGRLEVAHETDGLGQVLVYVYTNDGSGYLPQLRQFYASGGTVTSDGSLVSGGSNVLDHEVEYQIPARTLPGGSGRLYARLKGAEAETVDLTVTAYTTLDGTDLPGTQAVTATVTVTTDWQILDLCGLELPPNAGPASSTGDAVVRLTIVDPDGNGVELDEAWVFSEDVGALTLVECGTGTGAAGGPSNRVWLDPATVTNDGQPAVYIGHSADRSDAFNPGQNLEGWTPPTFEPENANVLTVTTGAEDAATTLYHYPRWLHHARTVA